MPQIEIICLANSRKHQGRCIAGLRADGGGWVRLISPTRGGALVSREYCYAGGKEPLVFDVARVGLAQARPEPHHPENWVIDQSAWQLVSRATFLAAVIKPWIETRPALFGDYDDAVPAAKYQKQAAPASLALVLPRRLVLAIKANPFERHQLRAQFDLAGTYYDLPVTDPKWETHCSSWKLGEHPWNDLIGNNLTPLLVTSISEPFGERCYKLVAGIIALPPDRARMLA